MYTFVKFSSHRKEMDRILSIHGFSHIAHISLYYDNVLDQGKDVVLYVWYDNEFGYTKQVIRLAKLIAKVRRLTYY